MTTPRVSRADVARCLAQLARLYGGTVDNGLVALYLEGLSDLTPSQLADGMRSAMRSCQRMPLVADLRAGLDRRIGSQPAGKVGAADCAICGGVGWESRSREGKRGREAYVVPCRCRT